MGRLIRITLGVFLAITGLLAALLPIVPGWFFLLLSLVVLSADIPLLRRAVCWIEKRFPITQKPMDRLKKAFHPKDRPSPPCETKEEDRKASAQDSGRPDSP